MKYLNTLILDDDTFIQDVLKYYLEKQSHVYLASRYEEASEILKAEDVHIMFLDIQLGDTNGLELLKEFKATYPELEIIMISGHTSFENAREAMRNNASDFIAKPIKRADILRALERTKKYLELKQALEIEKRLKDKQEGKHWQPFKLVFKSKAMQEVLSMAKRVAQSGSTSVLITGESGTGKEMIANGIHKESNRSNHPFVPVNCSSIPRELFESEFFGYKKGAFTGATQSRAGWFEAAQGGTLFLDEIADLDYDLQKKLLRVLEDRAITRLGDTHPIKLDVRVLAATNRNIKEMVAGDQFRIDLYHRVNVFEIYIPPLRERKDDIPILTEYYAYTLSKEFKKKLTDIQPEVFEFIQHYHFPGNVRELKNLVERALIMMDGSVLMKKHFTIVASSLQSKQAKEDKHEVPNVNTFNLKLAEKQLIEAALKQSGGNKAMAAKLLDISWQSLDRRLKKLNL